MIKFNFLAPETNKYNWVRAYGPRQEMARLNSGDWVDVRGKKVQLGSFDSRYTGKHPDFAIMVFNVMDMQSA